MSLEIWEIEEAMDEASIYVANGMGTDELYEQYELMQKALAYKENYDVNSDNVNTENYIGESSDEDDKWD